MPTRRQLLASLAALGAVSTAAACTDTGDDTTDVDEDTLVLRVWSEAAVAPYEEALAAFTKDSGIDVVVEAQEWDEYWTALPQDIATGDAADVYWMNTANLVQLQQGEHLVDAGAAAGDASSAWEAVATDLYRRDDVLWGVPQLWSVSMLAANRTHVDAVEVDPGGLVFDPAGGNDTLLDAAHAIMAGAAASDGGSDGAGAIAYGFSAQADRTAVLGPFIAAAGGAWQGEDDAYAFDSEQGIAAVQYLADLANVDHVAPPGPQTNVDAELCRTDFIGGSLALLQTGSYDLPALVEGIAGSFTWTLHPVVAGPQGRRPLVHAIAAVGIATDDDDRAEHIDKLLAFLGSADAQRPLIAADLGIPAHRDLRSAWQERWTGQGVDVAPLFEDMSQVALPETGLRAAAGTSAAMTIIQEVFAGTATAADALPRARAAADEAVA